LISTRNKLSILPRSELLKDISVLVSGTTLAQLIPILLQPVLRRFFSPDDFGAYAVYLSITGILVVIASLRYELAIILPDKDKTAANVMVLAILINLIFSITLLAIILLFGNPILKLINLPKKYSIYLYLIPAGVFLYSFYQSLNYWLIREKRFFSISLNKFVRRGTEGSGQLAFMLAQKPAGLVLGDILGHLTNGISGTIQVLKANFRLVFISITKIRYVSVKYLEYPKFNVLPGFMSACSYLLPAIFINKFFSTDYTGYFDLSKLMLSIPLALIATSISNVLLQRISENFRKNESILSDLFSIFRFVLLIALLEIIIVRIWGIELFSIFFGTEWKYSGEISRILVWSFAFNFIIASFSSIFISMKKIKILSAWQLIYFIAIFSLILFRNSSFEIFIRTYVLIEISCYTLISLIMVFIITKHETTVKEAKTNNK